MMRQLLSLFIAALCLSLSSATINQSTNQSINQPSTINYPDFADFKGKPFTVTYNARALLLNDNPSIFLSGSVHYPRFSVGQWLPMLQQAKAEGLNLVQIYVFWNGHEPSEGEFNWDDRYDLVRFLDAVVEAGLFANLRIGPYVCAEWDLGGIPAWLQFNRPGIRYRSFESQWRLAMKTWFGQVVAKTRSYFSDHGGPIILVQVENELNGADERYVQWCGDMAASFNLNVPIAMCNGQSANGTDVAIHPSRHTKDINDEVYVGAGAVTINTCNANDCTGFLSTHGQNHRILLDQPAIWTENEMWFTSWFDSTNPIDEGGNRTSQDVGFAVMRFIARGGSVSNDYMYFGGNNYGATAGGGVTTMYANGAHHHSDNLPNEPRYTNMNMMYQLLPKIANDLANNPAALDRAIPLEYRDGPSDPWKLGTQQLAFEYGKNLAFVESSAPIYLQTQYNNQVYDMASNSIIVIQNGAVIWNSSAFTPVVSHRAYKPAVTAFDWQSWSEPIFTAKQSADEVGAAIPITIGERPYEQLNMTRDLTEFLWYSTVINVAQDGKDVFFVIDSVVGQAFQLFIDGVSVSNTWDATHAWVSNIVKIQGSIATLSAGQHTVSLLATSIGVQNGMNADEDPITAHQQGICIGGNFTIGNQDFTHQTWFHRPYLVGEWLDIASPNNKGGVPWGKPLFHQPATWYTSEFGRFDLPTGYQFSVLFDMNGLTRGHVFINGHDLGRYWNTFGRDIKPTQRYYHIPQDWLYFGGNANMITIFEEIGTASLDKVQIVTSNIVYGSWGDDNDQTKPITASE